MKKIVLATMTTLVISVDVLAEGNSNGGNINHIASVGEAILFRITGNTEELRPTCASTKRFAVHKDSPHAPVVLLAFAANKPLKNVRGTGECTLWGNSEDLRWMEVDY